jgi:hypothetical protein
VGEPCTSMLAARAPCVDSLTSSTGHMLADPLWQPLFGKASPGTG